MVKMVVKIVNEVAFTADLLRDVARVECPLMVRWVIRSILHGGPIELFLIPLNAPQLVYQRLCAILYVGWCYIKDPCAAKQRE